MKAFPLLSLTDSNHFSNSLKVKLKHDSFFFISSLGCRTHEARNDGAPALGVIINAEESFEYFLTLKVVAVLKK